MLQGMTESQFQRPEGKLIDEARKVKGISQRKAADLAGISDSRWRQIVNGYVTVGVGEKVPVVGPDETIAKMSAPSPRPAAWSCSAVMSSGLATCRDRPRAPERCTNADRFHHRRVGDHVRGEQER